MERSEDESGSDRSYKSESSVNPPPTWYSSPGSGSGSGSDWTLAADPARSLSFSPCSDIELSSGSCVAVSLTPPSVITVSSPGSSSCFDVASRSTEDRDEVSSQSGIDDSDEDYVSVQPKHKFQPIILGRRLPLFRKCKAKLASGTVATLVFDDRAGTSQQPQILPKLVPKPKRAIQRKPKSKKSQKRQETSDTSSSDVY